MRALSPVPGWDIPSFLIADIFAAITGEQHPARPDADGKTKAERDAALTDALLAHQERMAARAERLAATEP